MSRIQCPRCLRPQSHCLCPLVPSLDSRTRVILLQHPSETAHALNTARLAALGLNNAELRVGEVFDDLAEWLAMPGYRFACNLMVLEPGGFAALSPAFGISAFCRSGLVPRKGREVSPVFSYATKIAGAAAQPFRGTRPLLQEIAYLCRSGLVPRKACAAGPEHMNSRQTPLCTRSEAFFLPARAGILGQSPSLVRQTPCFAP